MGSVFAQQGIHMTPEEFDRIHHGTLFDIMPRIFGDHLTDEESFRLGSMKEAAFRELYKDEIKPIDGLIDWLEQLKATGLKVGLATAADFSNADFTVDAIHIRHYFDCIVTSDIVKEGKPSPAVYLYAAQQLQVNPANCLVFEDTASGIQAATAAGMKVIGVATSLSEEAMQQLPVQKVIKDYCSLATHHITSLF
ncbi:HAD family hydrolase [Phnomibacter ginsenosidimutans]|uniref:HAD-IA family hydrolase n=1 Tax=Phnomibacter ginsenosidimutans TaxID=2676868 RepID=A0A6I6G9W0_9BACT|nr:HAD family hydrolase [Phnomibacter ginsenosidimutans]QGW29184.1 HAD-IA family hydrolase [Phnomibacter ginsenosidimutans]